jgi:sulfhydrogenase subunit beta (sulfur reductase)
MTAESLHVTDRLVVDSGGLQSLLTALAGQGYRVIGPKVGHGAIVHGEIASIADLPRGYASDQTPAQYRMQDRGHEALFAYGVAANPWKEFLLPAVLRLCRFERQDGALRAVPDEAAPSRLAFVGVRPCEVHAIAIQDKVLAAGEYVDPSYKAQRDSLFIVAVNCGQAGRTCFCASMKTGPRAAGGFDLVLTEVVEAARHFFLVEIGSARGADLMGGVPHRKAGAEDEQAADAVVAHAAAHMGRSLDTDGLKDVLYRNHAHPRWDDVAARCLTCANCTMVCPTCFCTTFDDTSDLAGSCGERRRMWDSCFTLDFSYIHGGSIRRSARARYRQWLTHKLASWIDQFGTAGCVGCGRCITWCPVGIDITAEARALREEHQADRQGSAS